MKKILFILMLFTAMLSCAQQDNKGYIVTDRGVLLPILATDPTGIRPGQMYWNSTSSGIRKFDGTTWSDLGDSTGGADNLGNHTATQALNLDGNNINNIGTATGSQADYTNGSFSSLDVATLLQLGNNATSAFGSVFDMDVTTTTNSNYFPFYVAVQKDNTVNDSALTYSITNLLDHGGTANTGQLRGIYTRTRAEGSGTADRLYGIYNETVFNSTDTGTSTLAYGITNSFQNLGTNAHTISWVVGSNDVMSLSNPNATYNNLYGANRDITVSGGTINAFTLLRLDIDQSGGSILDGSYLYFGAGINLTEAQTNDIKLIESDVDLPSVFAGTLESKEVIKTGGTSDDILLADGSTTSLAGLDVSLSVANTVYLDATNGNDTTGEYENPLKPFQTFSAALAALPADDGSLKFVSYVGDFTIDAVIPNRKLYFMTNENGTLTFTYNGNIYDNSQVGNVYNELAFLAPYGELVFNQGDFLANKTKIIVDCNSFVSGTGGVATKIFDDVEEIQFTAKSCSLPRAGIATITSTGLTNAASNVHTGNMSFTPFNSIVVLDSNVEAFLTCGEIEISGGQGFSLAANSVNVILNSDVRHVGTGNITLLGGEPDGGVITFNSVKNVRRARIPVLTGYSRIIFTGYVENWENEGLNLFNQTNVLAGDGTQSSIEFIDFTIANHTTTDTFFYAHSNTQSGVYARFKFIAKNFSLKTNARFLSVSNRAVNFELTNCVIQDAGTLASPSISRGDGLTSTITIAGFAPNYVPAFTDSTISVYIDEFNGFEKTVDLTGSEYTNDTTLRSNGSILLPANTLRDDKFYNFEIVMVTQKTGAVTTQLYQRCYVGTTSGASTNLIFSHVKNNSDKTLVAERVAGYIKNGVIYFISTGYQSESDVGDHTVTMSTANLDLTSDVYFNAFTQANQTSETITPTKMSIKIF